MAVPVKKIVLTFDDGPNPPYTNQILDILKKEKVKATFFVCGANVKRNPEVTKRISSEGHLLGNHTFSHRRLPTLLGLIYKEIIQTQELIIKLTGQKIKLFRPPWGLAPFWLTAKLKSEGFKIVLYDIVADYNEISGTSINSANESANKVLNKVHDKSIILLHDGHNVDEKADRTKNVDALKSLIPKLKEQNYQFALPTTL